MLRYCLFHSYHFLSADYYFIIHKHLYRNI